MENPALSFITTSPEQIFKFNLNTIRFTPIKEHSSVETNVILRKVLKFINDERLQGKGYIIDRNKQRNDSPRRELFMNYAAEAIRENVFKCSIALLKSGKVPMVKPKDAFELVPFDQAKGSIAILTHFFIDYSVSPAIMCVEFNDDGPRLSDIEYYFRSIAHGQLHLCKATSTTTFMDKPIDKTLEELHNVLKFEFKMEPQNITYLDNDIKGYYTGMSTIGNALKPKFVKVETYFQTPGTKIKTGMLNNEANSMAKNILNAFKRNERNEDLFDAFQITYEDKEGTEQIFNLLSGKKEIVVEVDPNIVKKTTEWFELIKEEFALFVEKFK